MKNTTELKEINSMKQSHQKFNCYHGHSLSKPDHLAFIMDGNGRWAQERALQRSEGHKAGVKVMRSIIGECKQVGIPYLSFFAFSTENWNRPLNEVRLIFNLLYNHFKHHLKDSIKNDIRILVSGNLEQIPDYCRQIIKKAVYKTRQNHGLTVHFCINYGGKDDFFHAVSSMMHTQKKDPMCKFTNSDDIKQHLQTRDLPDIDFLIRTGGEQRLSNFMLFHLAYAELYFSQTMWPDYTTRKLFKHLKEFSNRQRRFGSIKKNNPLLFLESVQ